MGIKKTSSPNFNKYEHRTSNTANLFTLTTRDFIRKKMRERTQRGTDIKGKKFKPYSDEYAKDKGRVKSRVTLTDTGDMLASIQHKQIENGMKMWIPAKEVEKARHVQAYGRKFFNIDKKQRAWIKKKIGKFIIKGVK
jgi:hypothetical protein